MYGGTWKKHEGTWKKYDGRRRTDDCRTDKGDGHWSRLKDKERERMLMNRKRKDKYI